MSKIVLITGDEVKSYLNEMKLAIEDLKSDRADSIKPMYYRNKDLKEIFGLCDGTIINWRKKNILPYTYIDSIYYYPVNELDELLKSNSNYDLMKIY